MQTPGMRLLGGLTGWLINPNHPHSYAWIQSRSAVLWPSVRVCKKPLCEGRWIFFANCSLEKVLVNCRFPSFYSSVFTFPSWWTSYLFSTQFLYLIFNHFKFHSSWFSVFLRSWIFIFDSFNLSLIFFFYSYLNVEHYCPKWTISDLKWFPI